MDNYVFKDAQCSICKKYFSRKDVRSNATSNGEELWCAKCTARVYKEMKDV